MHEIVATRNRGVRRTFVYRIPAIKSKNTVPPLHKRRSINVANEIRRKIRRVRNARSTVVDRIMVSEKGLRQRSKAFHDPFERAANVCHSVAFKERAPRAIFQAVKQRMTPGLYPRPTASFLSLLSVIKWLRPPRNRASNTRRSFLRNNAAFYIFIRDFTIKLSMAGDVKTVLQVSMKLDRIFSWHERHVRE